ncbi:MAG: hypothetical protein E3K32_12095 [wastewater metagenome]|nr:hypothetical protein [Candidatus Loosdrechtia aerotolerans]
MDPEDIISLLNSYFTEMTELIFYYGGTLDKFMGDGILLCIIGIFWYTF